MVGKSYHPDDNRKESLTAIEMGAGSCASSAKAQSRGAQIGLASAAEQKRHALQYQRAECLKLAIQANSAEPLQRAKEFYDWLYGENNGLEA